MNTPATTSSTEESATTVTTTISDGNSFNCQNCCEKPNKQFFCGKQTFINRLLILAPAIVAFGAGYLYNEFEQVGTEQKEVYLQVAATFLLAYGIGKLVNMGESIVAKK